jgi:ATP-dependent Clp protease protease subunit
MDPKEFYKYAKGHHGINSMVMRDYVAESNSSLTFGIPGIVGLTPNIIEERQLNVIAMDVFSRLMMDRIIFLGTAINDQVANIVNAQLLFLQSTDAKKDVNIYVNSPGGSVYAGLGIYDTMQLIAPDISTICTGMAASMGAILLTAGTKGKRAGLPHSRVMIHQPMGGAQGQASDIAIVHTEIQKLKKELYDILARHTGKEYEQIWNDADRDHWLTAEESTEYGLIDEVLQGKKGLKD